MGLGLRIWWRKLAFVSIHKSAVVIEKKKGVFRTLMLTTGDPEKFTKDIAPYLTESILKDAART
jgi:hypothetical protein